MAPRTIASEWRAWIFENKWQSVPDETMIDIIVQKTGADRTTVGREVAAVAAHPSFVAGQNLARKLQKLESLLETYDALGPERAIERRSKVSREEFFARYYRENRPVILTDVCDRWPARARWSPAYFKAHFGHAVVEVMTDRHQNPNYEIDNERHKRQMRLGDYADRVAAARESNDFYMVANNHALQRGPLAPLRRDLAPLPSTLDPARMDGNIFLWFGPGGTRTPLHHDTMNILLAQITGRKRVTMIPSRQTPLVYNHIGVFSPIDCEAPDDARYPLYRHATPITVDLAPGDALFIPVGWWHQVRALETSINVSFINFVQPNDFRWRDP